MQVENFSSKFDFSAVEIMSIHVKSKTNFQILNYHFHLNRRFEVHENKVEFDSNDRFQVKMTSRIDNFTLDHCFCRISIRKVCLIKRKRIF